MSKKPEWYVKQAVKEVLSSYGCNMFMPVQAGYGAAALDFICCYKGNYFSIETKAGKKTYTIRQRGIADNIEAAGGKVFLINEVTGTEELEAWLQLLG